MPEMMPGAGAPPAQPQPPGGAPPGVPPTGSTPATMPVANAGQEAAGLAMLSIIVRQMERAVPMLSAGSEAGRAVIDALSKLAKHVPAGSVSPGVEKSQMERLMMQQRQMGPQIAAMRNAQSQQQPPGGATPSPAAA